LSMLGTVLMRPRTCRPSSGSSTLSMLGTGRGCGRGIWSRH
jgi:hypothetical protein